MPRDETDYGTLLCWGRNELGRQRRPCVFHVIPAGERVSSTTSPPLFPYYFRARTPVKMCSTLMRYIGAIKACESEFLQMVIALLWAGLGWSRSRGEGDCRAFRIAAAPNFVGRAPPPFPFHFLFVTPPPPLRPSHPKLNFAIAYKIKSCLLSSFCESWRKRIHPDPAGRLPCSSHYPS